MQRLTNLLAPLGLLLIAGAALWSFSGRHLPGDLRWWLAAGGFLVLVHLLLRWDDVEAGIGGRQLRYGGNAFVLTLAVGALLAILNWSFVRPMTKRWDLTQNRQYSLSDQTRKVVEGLAEDVKVTVIGRPEELERARQRFEDYRVLSSRLELRYLDPVADPVQARSYEARAPWPQIFFERGEVRERISNDSEQDITNALIKVFRSEQKTVCILEGSGERDPADRAEGGLAAAKSALEASQYATRQLFLLREPTVPSECAVVVEAGAQNDLLPPAIDSLRQYVRRGGGLLVMSEPPFQRPQPNLDALLAEWDIEAGQDVVIEASPMQRMFGAGVLTPIALEYPYHEITKDFRRSTAFHTARRMQAAAGNSEGVVSQNLVQTSADAWAESDLGLKEPLERGESDHPGPVALGALATVTVDATASSGAPPEAAAPDASPAGEAEPAAAPAAAPAADDPAAAAADSEEEAKPTPRTGRVVAFGDVDFASNQFLGFEGNRDLFLNSVAWLAEEGNLISVRPREPSDQRLFMTDGERLLAFSLAVSIPLLCLALGVFSWWRRR